MDFLGDTLGTILPFLLVLGVLIFFHELGHYLAARSVGVHVEVFSIGFGREILGWTGRGGTRWKVGWIPLGGYVKLHGQESAEDRAAAATEARAKGEAAPAWRAGETFAEKPVAARAWVVAAGPLANFLLAAVLLAGMFMTAGRPDTAPVVSAVQPESAAARAGLVPGDRIVAIDGRTTARFEDIQATVRLRPGQALTLTVERDGARLALQAVPDLREVSDRFGNVQRIGLLGVSGGVAEYRRLPPLEALAAGAGEMLRITEQTLTALWQMIAGTRGTDEIGGPLRIAQLSGQVAEGGIIPLVGLMAILSVNLALINLFPIPILDGGHLVMYAYEAVRGRPLPPRAQEYAFRGGLAILLAIFVLATWNDLTHLRVVDWVARLLG
ncbi:RIP metalloprotease RseP [Elioraea sp. Yellowstone]|jgi:regulator of sigma E protease|uniref:RIP metalloprotease RseP n=1 Tax=Elioraea sp. Yellowstone TaxID=2592070 RepID=UPI0011506189|nr:RIP metalloprotease RseP [Elioraea sp. Yellowstone]TQF79413.1 RIP metalloprotease RseP [Elioraea sp. Yellowstone]